MLGVILRSWSLVQAVLAQSESPNAFSRQFSNSSRESVVEVLVMMVSVSFWAQVWAELPVMKVRAYSIFVRSSGKNPGWIAMASLIARMKPSVSVLSPVNLSGSATLIEWVEEMSGDVGMTICCAAATAAVEAGFARLFWKLLKWVRCWFFWWRCWSCCCWLSSNDHRNGPFSPREAS